MLQLARLFLQTSVRRTLALYFCSVVFCPWALGQASDSDRERAERYLRQLKLLQAVREAQQAQFQSLLMRDSTLEARIRNALLFARANQDAIENRSHANLSREFSRTQAALASSQSTGNSQSAWYGLQCNTAMIYLILNTNVQQGIAQAQVDTTALNQLRSDLQELVRGNEKNFQEFRRQVDWLGRRSPHEHDVALTLAQESQVKDDSHFGLALIECAAHRARGDFGECLQRLDAIDDEHWLMQQLHAVTELQLRFLRDDEALEWWKKEVASLGMAFRIPEALLVRGWIAMVEQNWELADDCATAIRLQDPDSLEGATLKVWAGLSGNPKFGKEAVSILRVVSIRLDRNDWYIHEAMAHAQAARGNWTQAKQAMGQALSQCPSHAAPFLEQDLQSLKSQTVPKIDWARRLKNLWTLP